MLNVHINSKSVIQRVATTITDELGQVGHKDVLQLENNSSVISQHSLSGLLNILANPVWFRPLHYISDRYITFWAECCRKKKGVQQNEQLCVFPIFARLDGLVHSNQHSLLPEMNAISLSPLTPMTSIQQRTPVFSADPKKFIIILMRSAAATEMTSSPTIN